MTAIDPGADYYLYIDRCKAAGIAPENPFGWLILRLEALAAEVRDLKQREQEREGD